MEHENKGFDATGILGPDGAAFVTGCVAETGGEIFILRVPLPTSLVRFRLRKSRRWRRVYLIRSPIRLVMMLFVLVDCKERAESGR